LLNDPLYIGWKHERVRGDDYNNFVDAFVVAVKKRFPNILLQWEDFAQINATPILEKYQNQLCTFNDDIQGTAAVAAGTLFAAIKRTELTLRDQQIVVVGAGSAGCGISKLIMRAMIDAGLSQQEATSRFYLIDRAGLVTDDMPDLLSFQKPFAQSKHAIATWNIQKDKLITLEDVVRAVKPTLLIGTSGQPGIFNETIIRMMAANTKHPIIFPLSNPTSQCEAHPSDLLVWTNGRAIIGTGSPFKPIMYDGKLFTITQTNNCYIFPGLGLGLIAVNAARVTDEILMAAAIALAAISHPSSIDTSLLPPLASIRDISLHIAIAVAEQAIASGLASFVPDNLEAHIKSMMWLPEYLPYYFYL
jgi:malate dehydrogenase (oxaloacetate-decarboxylating)